MLQQGDPFGGSSTARSGTPLLVAPTGFMFVACTSHRESPAIRPRPLEDDPGGSLLLILLGSWCAELRWGRGTEVVFTRGLLMSRQRDGQGPSSLAHKRVHRHSRQPTR